MRALIIDSNGMREMIVEVGQMRLGQRARVVALQSRQKAYRHRLLAMGLTPGTEFTLVRKAPLGDPIEIRLRGYALSLRQHEASLLQIEQID